MPKDATKNVGRYKVRGGELNEFDFHQNQEQFAEQPRQQASGSIPGTPPEAKTPMRVASKEKPTETAPKRAASAKKSASKKK